MPLTKGQVIVLQTLAASRDPESYVAGSTPLNINETRFSDDIDIFHDSGERVALTADADANTLAAAGFGLQWARRAAMIQTLLVSVHDETVKLEWVADSDFRFFPTVPDPLFGYTLHPVDLATNKVHAAAGRKALRDLVDLVTAASRSHLGRGGKIAGLYARRADRRNTPQCALSGRRMAAARQH